MPVYHDDGVSTPVEVSDVIIDDGSVDCVDSPRGKIDDGSGTPEDFWVVRRGLASL